MTLRTNVSTDDTSTAHEIHVSDLHAWYGKNHVVKGVSMEIEANEVTAIIGPSGCGKSTFVRCLNRMHESAGAKMTGSIVIGGKDIMRSDPVRVRRNVGMVFQRPNLFTSMSILDNVMIGLRMNHCADSRGAREIVEDNLRRAALWDEVKDVLHKSPSALSGGQQQRLAIARALALDPAVLLMDEPCSALDPISTARIEDLLQEIKKTTTIVIVTHNMQQAARVSAFTGFLLNGELVEFTDSETIFTTPSDKRTEEYITGRFG
jgi:phosphate transport system ATP-binding protein